MSKVKKMRLTTAGATGVAAFCIASAAHAQEPPPVTTIPDVGNFSLPEIPARDGPVVLPTPTPTPVLPTSRPIGTPSPAGPLNTGPLPPVVTPRPTVTPTPTSQGRPAQTRRSETVPARAGPAETRPADARAPAAAPAARASVAPSLAPSAIATPAPVTGATSPAPAVPPDFAPPAATTDMDALAVPAPESAGPAVPASLIERWGWPWLALIGLIAVAGAALILWRRRARRQVALPAPSKEVAQPSYEPTANAPVPSQSRSEVGREPQARAPASSSGSVGAPPRFLDRTEMVPPARLELGELTVRRAGLNMITATADVTVEVRNPSDVPARGVTLDVRLTSAQPDQDAAITAMFAGPVPRPAALPFDLAPGESRKIRTLVTMGRDEITVLEAGGRPMFVPVVAVRALHSGGQTVSVHALGIERPGQAKLGPFWLDQPRMFDTVGVRPHTGR